MEFSGSKPGSETINTFYKSIFSHSGKLNAQINCAIKTQRVQNNILSKQFGAAAANDSLNLIENILLKIIMFS